MARDELLHDDESIPSSEPAVATTEIASRSLGGGVAGAVIGAVVGLVIAAILFGGGGDDTALFWTCVIVGAVAGAVPGFVFGGGRGVRDARRQAEAEARGGS